MYLYDATTLDCPFKTGKCKGDRCMAWEVVLSTVDIHPKGYCKLIGDK